MFENASKSDALRDITSTYRQEQVHIEQSTIIRELVFSCFAVNYKTNNVEELIIPRGYNSDHHGLIHYRVIYQRSEGRQLCPIAVAERPVTISSYKLPNDDEFENINKSEFFSSKEHPSSFCIALLLYSHLLQPIVDRFAT
jgi:hypothetical protein